MPGILGVIRPSHPTPLGGRKVGCLRGRLPSAGEHPGLMAQLHYPADAAAKPFDVPPFRWFRREVVDYFADHDKKPRAVMWSLLKGWQLDPSYRPDGQGLPVVVLCSGLFGSMEMYSQLGREIASLGFIVVAIENEDGAGSYAVSGKTGEAIYYEEHPADIIPSAEGYRPFRAPYLEKRLEELQRTLEGIVYAARGSASAEKPASKEEAAVLEVLSRGDADRLILAGHSFGAASILNYLAKRASDTGELPGGFRCRGALILDLWPECLEDAVLEKGIPVPFGAMLSGEWQSKPEQLAGTEKMLAASRDFCLGAACVKGVTHQWISECMFWGPAFMLRASKLMGTAPPKRVFPATARALALLLEGILASSEPPKPPTEERKGTLRQALAAIDPEVLVCLA